ncbi:fumarylacetoacetate hydrolase family protein, partial [Methanobrevibacter sp. OttesenSCG-928-I08]|nr:fumarylacetoacetate hydrolase family protein [Methanobrevibacter sp. OttesenSCG-928-I08]
LIIDSYELNDIKIDIPCEPSKIVCVGLNYKDHADELNMPIPDEPKIFIKPSTTALACNENIIYPKTSNEVDFEGELGLVIGKKAKNLKLDEASDFIFGYTILNDVTARDIQRKEIQWTRAKSFDTFAPFGPFIETDFDFKNKKIQTKLNGIIKQDSNTNNMIFNPHEIISFISNIMTLNPGDIIATGTPPGVGEMKKGDIVSISIENLGTLTNKLTF